MTTLLFDITSIIHWNLFSTLSYPLLNPFKNLVSQLFELDAESCGFSNKTHRAGVSVKATIPDNTMATAIVKENSL